MLPVGDPLRPGRAERGVPRLVGAGDASQSGRLLVPVLSGLSSWTRRSEWAGAGALSGGRDPPAQFAVGTVQSRAALHRSWRLGLGPRRPGTDPLIAARKRSARGATRAGDR